MSLILLFFQTRLAIKKIRCVVVEVLLFSIIYTLALFSRCSSQLSHKYVIHAGKRKLFSTLLFRLQLVVCVAKLNSNRAQPVLHYKNSITMASLFIYSI